MENQDKKVLDLAMEAGRILLDAGAEIFRVEETMKRIATYEDILANYDCQSIWN